MVLNMFPGRTPQILTGARPGYQLMWASLPYDLTDFGDCPPPIQIGGCGFCTGFGSNKIGSKFANLPWKEGDCSIQSARNTEINSSAPWVRSPYGKPPRVAISSYIQPIPRPTVSRPFDRISAVVNILAAKTAGRCGRTITEVRKRIFSVTAET